ncbi:hypothetical protein BYT27DRAFT_7226364 [Phlegmacium glaucopus]|nr:hypothetical protein BYT27DRAFT_7226364 [Phlegmacium glaucopus]
MDNPQHYQPLSHALHPPSTTRTIYSTPTTSSSYQQKTTSDPARPQEEEEEEEEEEEDDDEEGLVEEQLNNNDADVQGSNHSSPKTSGNADAQTPSYNQSSHDNQSPQEPERKRRPGRPRGSKNRRPRVGSSKHEGQFYYHGGTPTAAAATTSSGPPQHPTMNAQNQQYYEFQWRVLNLCAEFYGAAEELVKGTAPLVVAQCYHMGPGIKIDPLSMLGEAKRICDTLLANPSQLVSNPPPPMYPAIPPMYPSIPHIQPQPVTSTSTISAPAPTSALANPPSVITNAQSFVVPLGAQTSYPQYPMYPGAPGQYATTPYYHQYAPYTAAGTYYPQPQQPQPTPPVTQPQPSRPQTATATTATTQPTATITTTPATGGTAVGNQGAWSDEETERLKKMAEDHRSKTTGEINWDAVIQEWGISRTRHQILIKATALGLKESSTRGVKRRREDGPSDSPAIASVPSTSTASNIMVVPSTSSPSRSGSTPAASPALQNLQRPPSAKSSAPITAAPAPQQLAWPIPVVTVNAPSPTIAPSPNAHEQRTSYYRPRPNQTDTSGKPNNTVPSSQPTMHHFMYTPNGQVSSGLRPKENGK